jgi:hypothetical protein
MYTSLVLTLATAISNGLKVTPESIWMVELPEARQILQICEAIVIARSDERLEQYFLFLRLF